MQQKLDAANAEAADFQSQISSTASDYKSSQAQVQALQHSLSAANAGLAKSNQQAQEVTTASLLCRNVEGCATLFAAGSGCVAVSLFSTICSMDCISMYSLM